MRIALDATSLPPAMLGAATYIVSLAHALAELESGLRLTVVVQASHASHFTSVPGLEVVQVPRMSPWVRILWEQISLPRICRQVEVDLLHSPHYTLPLARGGRSVVTFHDMTFFRMPEVHLAYKWVFFRTIIRWSARRADAILVPSASTQSDLARLIAQTTAKTHVIPLGVSSSFQPVRDPVVRRGVTERYGLPDEFLLYVGNLEPRKNLPRLLEAYASLTNGRVIPPLVLAGTRGWKDAPLREMIERLDLAGRLITPGYIPQEDLPAVYSMATAFVYPSLYEGFGLPVLEAMACGTPVITSNVSSMPEVAGDAAMLVSPQNVDALAEAMERLLAEPDLRLELSRRGMARAGEFTWRRAAEATLVVYRQVLEVA